MRDLVFRPGGRPPQGCLERRIRNVMDIQDGGQPVRDEPVSQTYFSTSGIPISKTAIVLFLILLQLASYNYAIRRLARTPRA